MTIVPASTVEQAVADVIEFAVVAARLDSMTEDGLRAGLGELLETVVLVAGIDDAHTNGKPA